MIEPPAQPAAGTPVTLLLSNEGKEYADSYKRHEIIKNASTHKGHDAFVVELARALLPFDRRLPTFSTRIYLQLRALREIAVQMAGSDPDGDCGNDLAPGDAIKAHEGAPLRDLFNDVGAFVNSQIADVGRRVRIVQAGIVKFDLWRRVLLGSRGAGEIESAMAAEAGQVLVEEQYFAPFGGIGNRTVVTFIVITVVGRTAVGQSGAGTGMGGKSMRIMARFKDERTSCESRSTSFRSPGERRIVGLVNYTGFGGQPRSLRGVPSHDFQEEAK